MPSVAGAPVSFGAALSKGLHDLGQPLTALECTLYLAGVYLAGTHRVSTDSGGIDPGGRDLAGTDRAEMGARSPGELRAAIAEAVVQCERTMARMRDLQLLVQNFEEETQ